MTQHLSPRPVLRLLAATTILTTLLIACSSAFAGGTAIRLQNNTVSAISFNLADIGTNHPSNPTCPGYKTNNEFTLKPGYYISRTMTDGHTDACEYSFFPSNSRFQDSVLLDVNQSCTGDCKGLSVNHSVIDGQATTTYSFNGPFN